MMVTAVVSVVVLQVLMTAIATPAILQWGAASHARSMPKEPMDERLPPQQSNLRRCDCDWRAFLDDPSQWMSHTPQASHGVALPVSSQSHAILD